LNAQDMTGDFMHELSPRPLAGRRSPPHF